MLHKGTRGSASYTLAGDAGGEGFRLDENPGGRGAADAAEFTLERPFASLLSTTRDVLLSPRCFFDELAPDGPLWPPVLYFLICYLATTLISLVATAALFAVPAVFVAANPSEPRDATSGLLFYFLVFVLLSLAFFVLVGVLFFASVPLQHAFVILIAGRDQRGLGATLRLSCYAVGAPVALGWIPIVGLLATLYCFYLYTTALRRVHRISTRRTLGAILIPLAILIILAVFIIILAYRAAQGEDLTFGIRW